MSRNAATTEVWLDPISDEFEAAPVARDPLPRLVAGLARLEDAALAMVRAHERGEPFRHHGSLGRLVVSFIDAGPALDAVHPQGQEQSRAAALHVGHLALYLDQPPSRLQARKDDGILDFFLKELATLRADLERVRYATRGRAITVDHGRMIPLQ